MLARAVVRVGCAAVLIPATLAACSNRQSPINRPPNSGSATASDVNGIQQITLITGDDYRFHPSTFTVHPGKVRVILRNTGTGAPHDLQVNPKPPVGFPAAFVPVTAAGQMSEATFTVPPLVNGAVMEYPFECTIHVAQGQTGTMIVTPG